MEIEVNTVTRVGSNLILEGLRNSRIQEGSYDLIPYSVIEKLIEDNYDAVVSTNEYNWVQQGRFNVTSNETVDVTNVNYLIQKQGYVTRLKKISETPSGSSFRYKFVRA